MQDAVSNSRASGSLNHLNLRFLSWLSARAKQPGGSRDMQLPLELQRRFAGLTHEVSAALAQCPYALFDLNFHDETHWRACLQCSGQPRVSDGPAIDPHTRDFVQLAVFYCWHMTISDPVSAQLTLGIGERLIKIFRDTSVDRLPLVSALHTKRLQPRWTHSLRYWGDLIAAAADPQSGEFRRVKLFGLQLAGASRL
jgi:hypothetical protein